MKSAKILLLAFIANVISANATYAGPCDSAWDGEKLAAGLEGKADYRPVGLRGPNGEITTITVAQFRAFSEAERDISRVAGISPRLLICASDQPNAFAIGNDGRDIEGVTIPMLKLVDGDRDMAAFILGHETAHHTLHHREAAENRDLLIELLGLIGGAVIEAKNKQHNGRGFTIANISATLVSRKFDRDQEREADETGFRYMVRAGYNPAGAIRLTRRMNRLGTGGAGIFFDNHPGWDEREARIQKLIAENPEVQKPLGAAGEGFTGNLPGVKETSEFWKQTEKYNMPSP
jgi:hypothetical protein